MRITITAITAIAGFVALCRVASHFVTGIKLDSLRVETFPQLCAVCGKGIDSGWEVRHPGGGRSSARSRGDSYRKAQRAGQSTLSTFYCSLHAPPGAIPWVA